MNRKMLQDLAKVRLAEAKALARVGLPDGAYYLGGYAVECALKACIAKLTRKHDFPDRNRVNDSYTHDLDKLLRAAGLEEEFKEAVASDGELLEDWIIVKDWTEQRRYELFYSPSERDRMSRRLAGTRVRLFLGAVDGVLPWIMKRW